MSESLIYGPIDALKKDINEIDIEVMNGELYPTDIIHFLMIEV